MCRRIHDNDLYEKYETYIMGRKMKQDLGYRRIQRTGRGSYIVSLPKEWVLEVELERGNELDFEVQEDSSLLLVPRKVLEGRKTSKETGLRECGVLVDRNDDPESVCRRVSSLYAISADLIHIRFKSGKISPGHRAAINNLCKNLLLGSEIIGETSDEITLQVLINHPDFPVERAIRRMNVLALSANRDSILALENMDESVVASIADICNDVERLNLYVLRQLKYGLERNLFKELGFKSPKEFLGYRIVANEIKSIAHNALNIANSIAALRSMVEDQSLLLNVPLDEELSSQVLEFNTKAQSYFEQSLTALFKRDYDHADRLISDMKHSTGLANELTTVMLSKKMDPNVSSIFRLILDSSRRIIEYGRNVAEVTLNRTVEEIS
jgi:phosphate uptake regulator